MLGILLNSVIEIIGLGALIPVINLVINPDVIHTNAMMAMVYSWSQFVGVRSDSDFLIVCCITLILGFLSKALFALLIKLFQARFSYGVAHRISGATWSFHFASSLEQMNSRDSGRILAEINGWPNQFAIAFLMGGLTVITEVVVIAFIAIGLICYEPILFLGISLFLGSGTLIIRSLTRRRLASYSTSRKHIEPNTNSLIQSAVRGFIEVISFRAEDAIRDIYLKDRLTLLRIASNTAVLSVLPAKLYEVLSITAIAGAIILSLSLGKTESSFVEILSLMAVGAYRTMPSLSRINGSIIQMRAHEHVLQAIEVAFTALGFLKDKTPLPEYTIEEVTALEARNLTLSYTNRSKPILSNFSFRFESGKIYGITGPSGSGKTTLLNSLLSLHKPNSGDIFIQQRTDQLCLGSEMKAKNWLQNIGYLSQDPFLFSGTLRENLTMRVPQSEVNEALAIDLIQKLKLTECLGPSPLQFSLQEGGNNLSGGQRQRLALLRALHYSRPVLILDEATSALDVNLRDVVFDLLRDRAKNGSIVILVTHDLSLIENCDEVVKLGAT